MYTHRLLAVVFMLDAYYWMVHSRRVTERLSSRSAQLRATILYVCIIGGHWLLAAFTFSLIFAPPAEDGPIEVSAASLRPSPLGYRLLFAVVLGLLGVTDMASWLATSSLPSTRCGYRRGWAG